MCNFASSAASLYTDAYLFSPCVSITFSLAFLLNFVQFHFYLPRKDTVLHPPVINLFRVFPASLQLFPFILFYHPVKSLQVMLFIFRPIIKFPQSFSGSYHRTADASHPIKSHVIQGISFDLLV